MSVYGHRSLFETVPPARRAAFNNSTLPGARDYEDQFYESWKRYRAANQVQLSREDGGDNSESERLVTLLMGADDDNGGGAAGAAAGAADGAAAEASGEE